MRRKVIPVKIRPIATLGVDLGSSFPLTPEVRGCALKYRVLYGAAIEFVVKKFDLSTSFWDLKIGAPALPFTRDFTLIPMVSANI